MKTLFVIVLGLIGVSVGAALLAVGNEGEPFFTNFLFMLSGLVLFVGAIYFVQRYWKSLKTSS